MSALEHLAVLYFCMCRRSDVEHTELYFCWRAFDWLNVPPVEQRGVFYAHAGRHGRLQELYFCRSQSLSTAAKPGVTAWLTYKPPPEPTIYS